MSNTERSPESDPSPNDSPTGEIPSGIDATELIQFLCQDFTYPIIDVYIEARLERTGLLPVLEQAGILPSDENPNPFDFETEEEQYDHWWEENLKERELFDQRLDDRADALKLIHIGALLGHLLGDDLYRSRKFPGRER